MQLLERPPLRHETGDPEALIKEARRLRRRRWLFGTLSAALLLGAGTFVVVELLVPSATTNVAVGRGLSAGLLPNGPLTNLQIAGPMAVAPDGALYIADDPSTGVHPDDRVLVRLPDGRFRVIAGTGRRGFGGDGGPAVRAELSDVTDLAVAPDGTLYIADSGRVRTVSRDGIIRTVAGNGRPARTIVKGTPARSAPLGRDLSIALSPGGQLYISVGSPWGSPPAQILRLTTARTLDPVRTLVTSAPGGNLADHRAIGKPLTGFDHIAVDGHGNIDIAGGPSGWGVWQITPNGNAQLISANRYAHGNGGADPVLERGPHGVVYAAVGSPGLFRVEPNKLVAATAINKPLEHSLQSRALLPLYFAMNRNGTLYAADSGPIGYQLKPGYGSAFLQHVVSIQNGRTRLLWQEHSATPK